MLFSPTDPRWNAEGRDIVGNLQMPRRCKKKLKELKKQLGTPPEDLVWRYVKD